jgi:PhnB protein
MSADAQPETQRSAKVKGGLVAYLQVDGAMKAVEFYKKAFGAEIAFAYPPDEQGRTMHAHLYVNGSSLMLGDPYPDYGHPLEAASGYTLQLMVDDIEAWFKRAVDAGCTVVTPIDTMFWGDRWGQVKDPFGVTWGMNSPLKQG